MDEFEKRLKDDAAAIQVSASPELERRIEASLRDTRQVTPVAPEPRQPVSRLWWASSLTGLATVAAVILLVNWDRAIAPARVDPARVDNESVATRTVPAYVEQMPLRIPLDARTAEFEAPLEEELQRLKADLEKARQTLARDIEFAF